MVAANVPSILNTVPTLLGRPADFFVWNAKTSVAWAETVNSIKGAVAVVKSFPALKDVIFGLPMTPRKDATGTFGKTHDGKTPFTLDLGANHFVAGGWLIYDWRPILEALLSLPVDRFPKIKVRLGWEFNLTAQPWCAAGQEANYARYWRNIVNLARSLQYLDRNPGRQDRFEWHFCPGITAWPKCNVEACYPGNAYVDVIGCDLYEDNEPSASATPEQKWECHYNGRATGGFFGLKSMLALATKNAKPFMIHECGCQSVHFWSQVKALGVDVSIWPQNSGGYQGADGLPSFKTAYAT